MATRDEILRFLIKLEGEGAIKVLSDELAEAARTAGTAEDDISGFVDELNALNTAAAEATRLQQLEEQIGQLSPKLEDAERAALALKLQLGSVAEPSRDMQRAFEAANNELTALRNEQSRYGTEAAELGQRLQQAGVATDNLGEAQQQLAQAAAKVAERFIEQQRAARETSERLADGDARFKRFAEASRTSAEALQRFRERADQAAKSTGNVSRESSLAGSALGKLKEIAAGVFAFFSVREAVNQIKQIVTGASDAEQQLAQLEAALASTGRQGEFSAKQLVDLSNSLRDVSLFSPDQIQSAQTRLLTYTNIVGEQFPAALQVAIDQSQRLGIGIEQSAELVGRALQSPSKAMEALGRQGFTLEAGQKELLKTLEETGRTAEAQAIIIDLLTESYGGAAAAARLNTFAGLIKGIRDQFADFQQTVADQGVFDFLKQQLVEVNAELKRLAADGTLTQYAKSVSDGIVATAEAVKSAVVFVRDYSGALILLGKAYLAVRFAPFIAGLAASVQSMIAATTQARTLTGAVGGLGARLAAIPSNIKIAIGIIAFDQLISQFARLQDAISQYRETLNEVELFEAGQRQLARDRIALVEQIIQTYGKYADTQIKTQEQLNALGEGDIILYRQRLEAAERYFVAVQAKAKEANDAAGLSEAQAKIRELREALAAVAKAYDGIRDARKRAFEDATSGEDAVQQALKDLNVSAQNMGQQFTEQGTKVTEAFSLIALSANTTGAQIGEAFTNALNQTQTTAEVERLQNALEEAFRRGAIGADQFGRLMDAAKLKIKGIEEGASKAAGSFQEVVEAGQEALRALLATLDVSRGQLAAKANLLGAKIGQALADGLDTGPLKAELAGVEAQINSTTVQINDTKAALDRFSASSDRAASSLGGISGAAGGASDALRSVEQAADDSFGNIGRGASTVTGGPLAALGAKFGELRDRAVALGGAAEEAFDSTLRVGESVRGTGITIEQFYQRQIDRIKLATDTVEELERAYNNSNRSAQNLANTSADIAQNATLSLEAERERNLEYARQLLAVEKERAGVQQASVTALTQQVGLTRELASTRENLPPQKIELVAANRQKPGELLGELSERDIGRLAELVVQRLAISRRGIF